MPLKEKGRKQRTTLLEMGILFFPKPCFIPLALLILSNCLVQESASQNLSKPSPGHYSGAYSFSREQFPTREIHISDSIQGNASITLKKSGEVLVCFGVLTRNDHSISRYVPGQSENSHETTKN
jgi:hypothetical protein